MFLARKCDDNGCDKLVTFCLSACCCLPRAGAESSFTPVVGQLEGSSIKGAGGKMDD